MTLINRGSITGVLTGLSSGTFSSNLEIFNTGTIQSTGDALQINDVASTVTNSGSIIGGSEAVIYTSNVSTPGAIHTLINAGTIVATSGPRAIEGGADTDRLFGGLSADLVLGAGGNDTIRGGTGQTDASDFLF